MGTAGIDCHINQYSGEDLLTDPAIYSREPEEELPYKKDRGAWQEF